MTKNNKSVELASPTHSFGFDFQRRRNLIKISDSIVAHAVGSLLTVLDVNTCEERYVRTGGKGDIGFVAANVDGTLIAIGEDGASPRIYLYSYPSLELENTIHGGAETAYSTGKFSPDGELLASVSGLPDYWLTLWDWRTGATVLRAKAYGQEVYDVSFLGSTSERLITHGAGHIQFWRMVKTFTGLKLQGKVGKFNGEPLSNLTAALELPFHDMIITSTEYGVLLIWLDGRVQLKIMREIDSGVELNCHCGSIETLAFVDNGSMILSAGDDGWIRKWDVTEIQEAVTRQVKGTIRLKPVSESMLAGARIRHICALGTSVLIQDRGRGLVTSWNADAEKIIVAAHSGAITACEAALRSTHLVTVDDAGSIHCYNYLSRKLLYRKRYGTAITALSNVPLNVDPDGRSVVVGFRDGSTRILVRHALGWRLALAMQPHSSAITAFSWNGDGTRLGISALDGSVFIFKSGTLDFRPIGFIKLAAESRVFWDTENVLAADVGATTLFFKIPSAAFESQDHTYEINIAPRVAERVATEEVDENIFQHVTHDGSHFITFGAHGSFELYDARDASSPETEEESSTSEFPALEAIDCTSSESLEAALQRSRAIVRCQNEAADRIRLMSLVRVCREEFASILCENALLPAEMRLSGKELLVDDLQICCIREQSVKAASEARDNIQVSVEQAESLSRELQINYFDKMKALPEILYSMNDSLKCSSFALRAGVEMLESDDTLWQEHQECVPAAREIVATLDEDVRAGIHKTSNLNSQDRLEELSILSSEARRRFERARRTEELKNLKKSEPVKSNTLEIESSERDPLSEGYPLRCDPDSFVPPEDKLTTEGKLSELGCIERELFNNLQKFNETFSKLQSEDVVSTETIASLCKMKTDTIIRSSIAKVSRLIVREELSAMPEYDARNAEMRRIQEQAKEEVEAAQASMRAAKFAVDEEQHILEEHEKMKKDIDVAFEKLSMPSSLRATLLTIFQKRVVNKSKNQSDSAKDDVGSESDDSDVDSDFGDEAYYSSSDEEDGDGCPRDCEDALYKRVCELREARTEAVDAMSEAQRVVDAKKKAHDAAKKKLRVAMESARALEVEAKAFEKVKQQSLNGLRAAFVLPVSCIDLSDRNCDQMIVFSKTKLKKLETQIAEWDAEIQILKKQQQELKREHAALIAQRSAKAAELQSLQRKDAEIQIRKFGKPVVLEDLDQVVSTGQSTDDLRDKLKAQEEQNAEELRAMRLEISRKEREVLTLTEAHTARLNELLSQNKVTPRAVKV